MVHNWCSRKTQLLTSEIIWPQLCLIYNPIVRKGEGWQSHLAAEICDLHCEKKFTVKLYYVSKYSEVSIKRRVLLNFWIFPKNLYYSTRSIPENIDRTVLFQGCHGQFLVSIKQPGLDIWKKSILNDQYYLFFKS